MVYIRVYIIDSTYSSPVHSLNDKDDIICIAILLQKLYHLKVQYSLFMGTSKFNEHCTELITAAKLDLQFITTLGGRRSE